MKKKGLLAILLAGALVGGVCVGCGENVGTQQGGHTHTFAESWTSDETYHWHAATCDHSAEVSERAEHVFQNGMCSVCGFMTIDENTDPNAIISDKVTEEEWRAALADELIHNFKMKASRTDENGTMSFSCLFWKNAFRLKVTLNDMEITDVLAVWDSAAGKGDRYDWFGGEADPQHNAYTHRAYTFEPNGFPFDNPEYSCEDGTFFVGELPYLRENFSKATYDEELGGYTLVDTVNEWSGIEWSGGFTFLIKIKNGRMCVLGSINKSDRMVGITYDYGKLTAEDFVPPAEYTET